MLRPDVLRVVSASVELRPDVLDVRPMCVVSASVELPDVLGVVSASVELRPDVLGVVSASVELRPDVLGVVSASVELRPDVLGVVPPLTPLSASAESPQPCLLCPQWWK